MARNRAQIPLRVFAPAGNYVVPTQIRGPTGVDFKAGDLLTLKADGRVAGLPSTINASVNDPIRYIALADYDGSSMSLAVVEEVTADKRFVLQISSGKATYRDIGKRGYISRNSTTGEYEFVVDTTGSAAVAEIVDTEDNFSPFIPDSRSNYNLVVIRFLESAINKAPRA